MRGERGVRGSGSVRGVRGVRSERNERPDHSQGQGLMIVEDWQSQSEHYRNGILEVWLEASRRLHCSLSVIISPGCSDRLQAVPRTLSLLSLPGWLTGDGEEVLKRRPVLFPFLGWKILRSRGRHHHHLEL